MILLYLKWLFDWVRLLNYIKLDWQMNRLRPFPRSFKPYLMTSRSPLWVIDAALGTAAVFHQSDEVHFFYSDKETCTRSLGQLFNALHPQTPNASAFTHKAGTKNQYKCHLHWFHSGWYRNSVIQPLCSYMPCRRDEPIWLFLSLFDACGLVFQR